MTRQQVRDFDRRAIQEYRVPGVVLMENAGRSAADLIEQHLIRPLLPAPQRARVAVVAGVGNNGGDGFVVARHLHLRGHRVKVFLVGSPAKMTPDAKTHFTIIDKLALDIDSLTEQTLPRLSAMLAGFDLAVDALGGTGIQGPLTGEAALAVEQLSAAGIPVAAIDIPTGLDCDTGQAPGPAVRAALTVTFVAEKIGFQQPGAEAYTGQVFVADIGVPFRGEE
jgi:NAD(P)H-hydrate epimerase